ncbi:MAG TPA: hypothetical protein VLB89_05640 [Gaiellaceae bacterium]|nr:hypothetical protein [Gaiellaceae bacterium]
MITFKLALALVVAAGWQPLPAAPITPDFDARTSVWTGKQMIVFGRDQQTALDSRGKAYSTGSVNVAAAYDPRSKRWRKLSPPAKTSGFMHLSSVWTGKEMLVWGQGTHLAYNPATDTWRQLPTSPLLRVHDGFGAVVWTGKEMLGWGGGCCGDAFSDGVAFNPVTNKWRALPRAGLAGDQQPVGVWTGKRYIVFARSRAAAYDPARNAWRRVAPAQLRPAAAVWGGARVFVTTASRTAFAYDPATDRWHKLPLLPRGRIGTVAVWDGAHLLVWGGARGGASLMPGAKQWTPFARGPLPARLEPTAVWTGSTLLVWGGVPTKTWGHDAAAGAAYTPPAAGCGDSWTAENMRVTRQVKAALRVASGATHGPLAGHTYYGMYSGTSYALATFGRWPTVFRTDGGGRWHVRATTVGRICRTVVPAELLQAWSLRGVGGGCYVEPR